MSYFSDQDIDTRTCGQADEDAWLDIRDGYRASAPADTTSIKYDRISKDYAIYDAGRIIGYGRTFHEAEVKRTAYLADRDEDTNACAGFGCVDGCGDCVEVTA